MEINTEKIKKVLKNIDWKEILLPYVFCILMYMGALAIINGDWYFIPENTKTAVMQYFAVFINFVMAATFIYATILMILHVYQIIKKN